MPDKIQFRKEIVLKVQKSIKMDPKPSDIYIYHNLGLNGIASFQVLPANKASENVR